MNSLRSCHSCGCIQIFPALSRRETARCCRCQAPLRRPGSAAQNASRTAAAALGSFFLFWPAVLLPILRIEQLGHRSESSILVGTVDLLRHGDWFVGGVVLIFSVVFPLVKMALLLELSLLNLLHRRHKALTYRIMEHAGKWSMMDVLLLAFLVMLIKVGNLMTFHFGPAVIAFVLCVIMNMVASMIFDPHGMWEDENLTQKPSPESDR